MEGWNYWHRTSSEFFILLFLVGLSFIGALYLLYQYFFNYVLFGCCLVICFGAGRELVGKRFQRRKFLRKNHISWSNYFYNLIQRWKGISKPPTLRMEEGTRIRNSRKSNNLKKKNHHSNIHVLHPHLNPPKNTSKNSGETQSSTNQNKPSGGNSRGVSVSSTSTKHNSVKSSSNTLPIGSFAPPIKNSFQDIPLHSLGRGNSEMLENSHQKGNFLNVGKENKPLTKKNQTEKGHNQRNLSRVSKNEVDKPDKRKKSIPIMKTNNNGENHKWKRISPDDTKGSEIPISSKKRKYIFEIEDTIPKTSISPPITNKNVIEPESQQSIHKRKIDSISKINQETPTDIQKSSFSQSFGECDFPLSKRSKKLLPGMISDQKEFLEKVRESKLKENSIQEMKIGTRRKALDIIQKRKANSRFSSMIKVCCHCSVSINQARTEMHQGGQLRFYHPECCVCCCCLRKSSQYYKWEDWNVCEECHYLLDSAVCSACLMIIKSEFFRNGFWNDITCPDCQSSPKCDSCQKIGGKGRPLYQLFCDRGVCFECLMKVVITNQQVRALFEKTSEFFLRNEMGLPCEPEVFLAQPEKIEEKMKKSCRGFCQKSTKRKVLFGIPYGTPIQKKVEGIVIQYGLQVDLALMVLAHEYIHAWFTHFSDHLELPKKVEEGCAELGAYLMAEKSCSEMFKFQMYLMENNKDPIYGVGFQEAKKCWQSFSNTGKGGILEFFQFVAKNKKLP